MAKLCYQRFIAVGAIADEFLRKIHHRNCSIKVGGMDAKTQVGPLSN
jgi:acyl-CoA reductase-like NAD-dependent aldehyde dehydrogenase